MQGNVKVGFARDGLVISLSGNVLFDSGQADLRPDGLPILDEVAWRLASLKNELRIEGHTDNIPITTPLYSSNWELSAARATTVARYLAEHGLAPKRLSAAGYGEYRPVASNDTREGRSQNRRVDIVVLAGQPSPGPQRSGGSTTVKGILSKLVFVVLGLALGGGGVFGATQVLGIGPGAQPKEATAAVAKKAPAEQHPPIGVTFPLRERVVNLADVGVMRYLKTTIVLDLADPTIKGEPPKGDDLKKHQDDLAKDLRNQSPVMEDQIVNVLSSRTAAELMSPDGKQKLRDELKSKLNTTLGEEKVLGVYFTDFIVQ